uniref:BURP domain-containing protein n=1 Tax=Quercus lobata TaxID=97700 RepID=A0A7N2KMM3_QUELO
MCETPGTAGEDGVLKETKKQEYRITGVHRINANKGVVCHKQNYACAVFYCHEIHDPGTYMVPLVSSDGTRVNAIAACHTDASVANAFKVLKVKPGTVPICHFLASDTLLWVPNSMYKERL